MKTPLRRSLLVGGLLWLGPFTPAPAFADLSYPIRLEKFNDEIRRNPSDYLKRVQRAFLILDQGKTDEPSGEDIDSLLAQPRWRTEGERLQAKRLFLLGRLDESKALIRKNLSGGVHVQEQARLLASIELSRKDTAAAIAAYRFAWERGQDENDYVDLLNLHLGRGEPPEKLLSQATKLYPRSPGAIETAFDVYFASGRRTDLLKCRALSDSADVWWPLSVDWKLRHARALMGLGKRRDAEAVLLRALDVLDGDERIQGDEGIATTLRKDIFTLLEAARK